MTSHTHERAQEELEVLDDRLGKLEAFLDTGRAEKFAPACQSLLYAQRDAMRIYSSVLRQRIENYL